MADIFLEYGGDLVITQTGDIQMANGWDEVRQRITRLIFTTAAQYLPNGQFVNAQYIFDTGYGIGANYLVGQNFTPQQAAALQAAITQAVQKDPDINAQYLPQISVTRPSYNSLQIQVNLVLRSGQVGNITFTL